MESRCSGQRLAGTGALGIGNLVNDHGHNHVCAKPRSQTQVCVHTSALVPILQLAHQKPANSGTLTTPHTPLPPSCPTSPVLPDP